ncbi:MAG: type II secretion system F family protein, partial [Kiritimatiellae bacterium]|nr:type II secretion system F family protein [Kiritimatiellia bacterium]
AAALDRRLRRIPLLGPAHRELSALRFLRVLALLLERGVGLVEALPLAARASSSPWLAAEIDRETTLLSRGKPLADVFRDAAPLPPSLASWVRAGQSGGDLPGLLLHAAAQLRQSFDRRSARALTLLETSLTLLIGLLVALLALAVILPVLQMNPALL